MTLTADLLRLQAPCKVNLLLKVISRRGDGYHELLTWMQKLDLYDVITLELLAEPGIELHCDNADIPGDSANLAWRAAETFFAASSRSKGCGVRITLCKNIPSGAGLGGGSSDAGTVLRGLNTLVGNEFSEQALIDLATGIGADVPFFAVEHIAVLATGIGEMMKPVQPLTGCTFILVNPGFSVSTKWVFENLALTRHSEDSIIARFRKQEVDALSLNDMANDLELVTSGKFSEIERMKEQLLDAGAYKAMMSGSGPTVFGVFPDDRSDQVAVQGVAEKLRLEYRDRVFVTRSCVGAWPSGQGTGF